MKNRQIFAKIWEYIDTPDIVILNGARQVGKSTLLKMTREKLNAERNTPSGHIHTYDLEKVDDLALWSNQTAVLALPFFSDTTKHFVFIDEFQRSTNIGSTLKVIHDHYPQIKCFATGSATWYTSIDESMAGRKIVIPIWPLSFSEFLEWQENQELYTQYKLATKNKNSITIPIIEKINLALVQFLTYGGYPAVVNAKETHHKTEILSELINSYLLRDIQLWNYATDPLQVKKILTLLASNTGGLLDIQNLCVNASITRPIATNRLNLLENTFIINLLKPYFTNKISELIKNPKVYMVDTGLANNLLDNFIPTPQTDSFGKLAENFVVMELYKQKYSDYRFNFWRTKQKQEVDIIIQNQGQLIPVEVKSGNCTTIPTSLTAFIKKYHPKIAYVLNWSHVGEIKYENCNVLFRTLWQEI